MASDNLPQMLGQLETTIGRIRTFLGYGTGSGAMPAQMTSALPRRVKQRRAAHSTHKALAAVTTTGTTGATPPVKAKRVISRAARKKLSAAATERWAKRKAQPGQMPKAA
jgi:hypothetical protein